MVNDTEIKNFLELISTHLPDMLWAKDIDGKYLFANKAICDHLLMASDTEEPIGKTDVFFALRERSKHPENSQWHTFGELCHDSDHITLEHMCPMRFEEYGNIRGELVYLDVHKAPFYDKNGNLIGVIGSGRDITVQKRLEDELNTTKRLIQSGPVVVFEWGSEEGWPIHFVSPNIDSVLGINSKKLLSKKTKFSDYIHPDDLEKVIYEVTEYIKTNTTMFVQEYRVVNEASQIIWVKDYTVVEFDQHNSLTRIKGYIFDDTARKEADNRAEYLNHHDQLTGLPNRTKIGLDIAKHSPQGCAIFNIDSFREINDFFGVSVGDDILIQLAQKAQEMKIPAYRIGGDEFAVLFYQPMTRTTLKEHLEQLLSQLHEMKFTVANEIINIRFNVGAALGSVKLLTRADIALHSGKDKKMTVAIYEEKENIEESYKKNIAMAATVHEAILEGRIVCHYQPIHTFKDGKITKYETLVRIMNKDGSLIAPNEFLPIAKKTKLYPRITREVVYQACQCFASKTEEFSINLSIDDINDPYTVQEIVKCLIDTDTAHRVVFEILESEGIENYESVVRFITQIKSLGAKIAIDDFGTGYSNFEHILKLNVDYIKIDGSLIRGIASNSRHHIIVETIAEFAKKISAQTIAEYVCDEEVYEKIKALRIDYAQGYYTGKPIPL